MSIHGTCFDNGMHGHCDVDCEQFQDGECPAADVVVSCLYRSYRDYPCKAGKLEEDLIHSFGDVKLWVLRHGEKLTDLELLTKSLGY